MSGTNQTLGATEEPRAPCVVSTGALPLAEAVLRYGRDTVAFQGLAPGTSAWSNGAGGWVTYVDTGHAWLAVGSPLCPPEDMGRVARAFVTAARAAGRRAGFCAAEAFPRDEDFSRFPLGQQPIWDPRRWDSTLAARRSLREQIRRARAKGVRARVVGGEQIDQELRPAVEALSARWLAMKRGGPLGFLLAVNLFDRFSERFYVVAEWRDRVAALLAAVPVPGRGGFFFEDILRSGDAPNGTVELLVDTAMRALADHCGRVTMGLVPLTGPLPVGLRLLRTFGGRIYDFDGLRSFRDRLAPESWEPVWFVQPRDASRFLALCDIASALTAGRPLRFALRAWREGKGRP